jgi:hypothetical protein
VTGAPTASAAAASRKPTWRRASLTPPDQSGRRSRGFPLLGHQSRNNRWAGTVPGLELMTKNRTEARLSHACRRLIDVDGDRKRISVEVSV